MNQFFLFPYLACILFSALMAFIYRNYLRSRMLNILLPYLIYVFIQETTLITVNEFLNLNSSNAVVYNIYVPISATVFFWVYYQIQILKSFRKLIILLYTVYIAITILNYCFIESIFTAGSYTNLARSFVITSFGLLFLFKYFNLDNPAEEKYWRPLIWITVGIVIFYPVISISFTFHKYLLASNATLYGVKLYQIIPKVMSIFMYSCFSYAFYLCKKKI